jgi:hypothetical protein
VIRLLCTLILFSTLAVGQARADLLELNYLGSLAEGSSLAGNAFSPGTDFEIHAFFDSVPEGVGIGIGNYQPIEITVMVGGTTYSGIDASNDVIQLGSLGGSVYYAFLGTFQTVGFVPTYTVTTPELDATAASPTVFSGYAGSVQTTLTLSTISGDLVLTYDNDIGVATSITAAAVPEPSSVVVLATGAFGLLGYGWHRRKRGSA